MLYNSKHVTHVLNYSSGDDGDCVDVMFHEKVTDLFMWQDAEELKQRVADFQNEYFSVCLARATQ